MPSITRSHARNIHEEILNQYNTVRGTTERITKAPNDTLAGEVGGFIVTFSAGLNTDYETVDKAAREFGKELSGLGIDFNRNYDDKVRNDPISGDPSDGPYIEMVTEELL